MKTIVLFLFAIIPFICFSQKDTTIYFGVNGKITTAENWNTKKEINYKGAKKIKISTIQPGAKKNKLTVLEKIRKIDENSYEIKAKGDLFSNSIIRNFEALENGKFRYFDFENNNLVRSGITLNKFPLILDGKNEVFYQNGTKKSVAAYENNQLLSNKNWLENGEEYIENIFYSVDEVPLFLQGMGTMHSHILKTFKNSGIDLTQISGSIKVGFVVMENGRIDGIKIERGINQTLDNLALKAFFTLMGDWQPARLNGEIVRCYQVFPINFMFTEYDYDFIDFSGGRLNWQIN